MINYDEMFTVIRGTMNNYRNSLVVKAFENMDVEMHGELSLEDIRNNFNPRGHPDLQIGKYKENEIYSNFFDTFE